MKNLRIIILLVALLLLVKGYKYFSEKMPELKPIESGIANQQTTVNAIDSNYQANLKRILATNENLELKVKITQDSLLGYKHKVARLQSKVSLLASQVQNTEDTTIKVEKCDSLAVLVDDMILANTQKDSIYESIINNINNINSNKDTALLVCRSSYTSLRAELDTSLEQQRLLTENLNQIAKKQKKKALVNKIVGGGVIVGSVVAFLCLH